VSRNRQLVRVLNLLALIGTQRRTLDELAEELAVSTRTIRRDLDAIQAAYLPLTDVRGTDGQRRYRLMPFGGSSVTTIVSQAAGR